MPTPSTPNPPPGVSRRGFLTATGALAGAVVPSGAGAQTAGNAPPASPASQGLARPVALKVNGRLHELRLEPRVTLLDALRENMGLMGTKKGCDRGQCGACTVLVDGQRINACLTLAVMQEGREVTTIEGLGEPGHLHEVQQAFIDHDAFQCGYCTPGQICSAVGLLGEAQAGAPSAVSANLLAPGSLTDDEIRERMSGNLCRCGAYANIVQAVRFVAQPPARSPDPQA